MNSPREVTIVKMHAINTIASYRESKKVDKYVVELATRAADPAIRNLAVQVLNEYHAEVRAAQDAEENKELMATLIEARDREVARMARIKKEEEDGAKTVPERYEALDATKIIANGEKRAKSQPKPLLGPDYELWSDDEYLAESDSSDDTYVEDEGSESPEEDVCEERRSMPLTERQRLVAAAKEMKTAIPEHDERTHLLVN